MKAYITKKFFPFVPEETDIVDRTQEGDGIIIYSGIRTDQLDVVKTFTSFLIKEHKDEYFRELK